MANFFFSEVPLEISHIIIKMYAEKFSFYSLVTKGGSVKESLEFLQNRLVSKLFRDVIEEWFIENWGVKRWRELFGFEQFKDYIYCLTTWKDWKSSKISCVDISTRDHEDYIGLNAPLCKNGIISCTAIQMSYSKSLRKWPKLNYSFDVEPHLIWTSLFLEIDCHNKTVCISCDGSESCHTNQGEDLLSALALENYTLINKENVCEECQKIAPFLSLAKENNCCVVKYGS